MTHKQHKREAIKKTIFRIFWVMLGAVISGLSLELLLVPNNIIDGGVVGISIMIAHITGWKLGIFLFLFNVPFLIFGYKEIGKTFMFSTLLGIISLSVATNLFHHIGGITHDLLLASVFGGMFLGAGVGIVIRNGGALDGIEVVAIWINDHFPYSVGQVIMIFNVFILGSAGFVFGWENAAYSIITFLIAFVTIDKVVEGMDDSRRVIIISKQSDEIAEVIQDRLGRTVTLLHGKGGYSKENVDLIYCVVSRLEESKLKAIVEEIDESAFMEVTIVASVRGGQFQKKSIH